MAFDLDSTSASGAQALGRLLDGFSVEATARQVRKAAASGLLTRLPPGTSVYVPFLPGQVLADLIDPCRVLASRGFRPVPHLAARAIPSPADLDEVLGGLVAVGADAVLLIAGDLARPAGPFTSAPDVLETGLLERHGIGRIGVAGHPDGHPVVDGAALDRALDAKLAYARATGAEMWIVTQFTFDAGRIAAFERGLRKRGVNLPVRVGLPGPTDYRALAAYALRCGVGTSMRMLKRRPDATRLLRHWTPDVLAWDLAAWLADEPDALVDGVHLFPFGGLGSSLDWLASATGEALGTPA